MKGANLRRRYTMHPAGGSVLDLPGWAFAARLREATYDIDVLARLKVAMLRPPPVMDCNACVTLSIGIAYCQGELSARDFMHLADRARHCKAGMAIGLPKPSVSGIATRHVRQRKSRLRASSCASNGE